MRDLRLVRAIGTDLKSSKRRVPGSTREKTSRLPSGDHAGKKSPVPWVRRVGAVPSGLRK